MSARCRHHRKNSKLIAPGGAAAASIDHRLHVPIQYKHSPNLAPFLGSSSQERGTWISAKSRALASTRSVLVSYGAGYAGELTSLGLGVSYIGLHSALMQSSQYMCNTCKETEQMEQMGTLI